MWSAGQEDQALCTLLMHHPRIDDNIAIDVCTGHARIQGVKKYKIIKPNKVVNK